MEGVSESHDNRISENKRNDVEKREREKIRRKGRYLAKGSHVRGVKWVICLEDGSLAEQANFRASLGHLQYGRTHRVTALDHLG